MLWVRLSEQLLAGRGELVDALDRFKPPSTEAGRAAEEWLREHALQQAGHVATWLLPDDERVLAFHSLTMASVELSQRHRRSIGAAHPTQGAVLIAWLARAEDATVALEEIVSHALGLAQQASRWVGAACVVTDPYDEAAERIWVERARFRRSAQDHRTAGGQTLKRLWAPLAGAG